MWEVSLLSSEEPRVAVGPWVVSIAPPAAPLMVPFRGLNSSTLKTLVSVSEAGATSAPVMRGFVVVVVGELLPLLVAVTVLVDDLAEILGLYDTAGACEALGVVLDAGEGVAVNLVVAVVAGGSLAWLADAVLIVPRECREVVVRGSVVEGCILPQARPREEICVKC